MGKNIDDFTPEKTDQLVKEDRQGYLSEADKEHQKNCIRSIMSYRS